MRTRHEDILFLDFDGVLHPIFPRKDRTDDENRHFVGADRLATVLDVVAPNIRIVVSSTWRYNRTLNQLRTLVGHRLGKRIIDVTPILNLRQPGCRELEAQMWRAQNNHVGLWFALDDVADIWTSHQKVMITDDGFRDAEAFALMEFIGSLLGAAEAPGISGAAHPQIYLPDSEEHPGDIADFGQF